MRKNSIKLICALILLLEVQNVFAQMHQIKIQNQYGLGVLVNTKGGLFVEYSFVYLKGLKGLSLNIGIITYKIENLPDDYKPYGFFADKNSTPNDYLIPISLNFVKNNQSIKEGNSFSIGIGPSLLYSKKTVLEYTSSGCSGWVNLFCSSGYKEHFKSNYYGGLSIESKYFFSINQNLIMGFSIKSNINPVKSFLGIGINLIQ